MKDKILEYLEKSKTDRLVLRNLKAFAVKCGDYALASEIREKELEYFPDTEEIKKEKELAKELNLLFRMVDLNVSEDVCWIIDSAIKARNEKKGEFSLVDAAKLTSRRKEIFNVDSKNGE